MAGKESRSKGSGRGLKGDTGFSGDNGRELRGDEHEGGASPDNGVDATKSLGRFGGRTSRSGSRETGSAAISEEGVDESQPTRARQAQRHPGAARSILVCHVQPKSCLPVRDRSRRYAQEITPDLSRRRPLLGMKRILSLSRAGT